MEIPGFVTEAPLGRGGYGRIYSIRENKTHEVYALKTEDIKCTTQSLQNEIRIMERLPPDRCFPHIKANGVTEKIRYYIMPLYGPSLSRLLREIEGQKFTLGCALRIAFEMISIIEKLHEAGIVHCDIKPGNFLLNNVSTGGFVLTDFGLSSLWLDPVTKKHIARRTGAGFRGTLKYASVHVHNGCEPTRRDDIISWFYSMIELAKGKLPWKDVKDSGLAMSCKQTMNAEKLCSGLPTRSVAIWNLIENLEFDSKPDYATIKRELRSMAAESGIDINEVAWDWSSQQWLIRKVTMYPELFCEELAEKPGRDKKSGKRCNVA